MVEHLVNNDVLSSSSSVKVLELLVLLNERLVNSDVSSSCRGNSIKSFWCQN